jgi:hypothetical protein
VIAQGYARSVNAATFASIVGKKAYVRNAEMEIILNTTNRETGARIVVVEASASTGEGGAYVRNAEAETFVCMVGREVVARNVEAAASVSMVRGGAYARSAGAAAFASTAGGGTDAKSAGAAVFAGMAGNGAGARNAGAVAFASMAGKEACARSAGAEAYVSTAEGGADVRNACAVAPKSPKHKTGILQILPAHDASHVFGVPPNYSQYPPTFFRANFEPRITEQSCGSEKLQKQLHPPYPTACIKYCCTSEFPESQFSIAIDCECACFTSLQLSPVLVQDFQKLASTSVECFCFEGNVSKSKKSSEKRPDLSPLHRKHDR